MIIAPAVADSCPQGYREVTNEADFAELAAANGFGRVCQRNGNTTPPESWETGFKDTVVALPGQVTRVRAQFPTPGQFVWHCHIVEHEDNEMMRPYRIGPLQDGQPPDPEHG